MRITVEGTDVQKNISKFAVNMKDAMKVAMRKACTEV